ncbi:MAG: 3-dehydroquinate synthase family protein [Paludibacteraceae bacterium]|nr:3-dehydroquinate synthase family protein [Paludibacteraceae bacterium]
MYFVLTTSSIWQLCHKSFADQPWAASPRLEIPDGEQHKTLATVERIWQFLLDHRATRDDVLVCVGGGVICDLGGFAASTYKRGMPHINVPTTLLAMVDAASGGKTGFDYAGIKNAIGTYAQPLDTLLIPSLITTLPSRELLSGYGEMLKHALLDTPDHWHQLLRLDLETEEGVQALMPLIARSRAVKERIVAADPREHGLRRALNLGHTVGHALEAQMLASGHPAPHGYCIVWGMVAALYLSILHTGDAGVSPAVIESPSLRTVLRQLEQVMLRYYGRPVCNCQDLSRLLCLIRQDKKNTAEGIRCTLLRRIGEPLTDTIVSPQEAEEALSYLFSL